jgi:hypothetical protein
MQKRVPARKISTDWGWHRIRYGEVWHYFAKGGESSTHISLCKRAKLTTEELNSSVDNPMGKHCRQCDRHVLNDTKRGTYRPRSKTPISKTDIFPELYPDLTQTDQ